MNEYDIYDGSASGAQIDAAVQAALNPDSTPTINSSNLVTSGGVAAALSTKADTSALNDLSAVVDTKADESDLSALETVVDGKADASDLTALETVVAGKQDALTFDNVPTANSANPVKSGGVFSAEEALKQMILASFPTDTITDVAVASFPDGADDISIKSMTVNITPVQSGSGDPSPTNVRPISGWTGANITRAGKNLFDKSTVVTGELNSTGGINTAATTIRTSAYIKVNPSTEYILYDICSTSSVSYCWAEYDGNKSFISTGTMTGTIQKRLTTSETTSYIRVCVLPAKLNSCIVVQQHDINPAYSPYNGTTYPVSWQTEAGTVYGGTLRDNGNGTWTLTATDTYFSYTGAEEWNENANGTFYTAISGNFASGKPLISNMFIGLPSGSASGLSAGQARLSTARTALIVYASGMTLAQFKTLIGTTNLQVIIPLAAPQTYHLTAASVKTLLGDNNIWADTGDVEVEYRADPTLYIERILAPADDDMIADTQIASGQYFIISGNLYYSTTTIPAGDTITPGTNCIKTDLAAALNRLGA